jgi:hypothetical protein
MLMLLFFALQRVIPLSSQGVYLLLFPPCPNKTPEKYSNAGLIDNKNSKSDGSSNSINHVDFPILSIIL